MDELADKTTEADFNDLSRFILDRRHFSPAKSLVKPSAFVPYPGNRVSAIWIDQLAEPDIWQIGDAVAGQPRGKPAVARADFKAVAALNLDLTIIPDTTTHSRHVDLCGWPPTKDEQKAVALDLCNESILRVR